MNIVNTFKLGLAFAGLAFSFTAQALDFRSIAPAKVILYDAPSLEASKLYVLGQGYPVEVIVNLGAWIKIRDAVGALSWVEGKQLSTKKMLLVLAKTDIKASADLNAATVANLDKDVVLELIVSNTKAGWIKVKHRDGITGFMQSNVLWGAN